MPPGHQRKNLNTSPLAGCSSRAKPTAAPVPHTNSHRPCQSPGLAPTAAAANSMQPGQYTPGRPHPKPAVSRQRVGERRRRRYQQTLLAGPARLKPFPKAALRRQPKAGGWVGVARASPPGRQGSVRLVPARIGAVTTSQPRQLVPEVVTAPPLKVRHLVAR